MNKFNEKLISKRFPRWRGEGGGFLLFQRFILKVNHAIFYFYYSRVPQHFRQWTFFKSISLLIQNYQHQEGMIKGKDEVISTAIREADKRQKQIFELHMKLMSDDSVIDSINNMFGTGISKISDN